MWYKFVGNLLIHQFRVIFFYFWFQECISTLSFMWHSSLKLSADRLKYGMDAAVCLLKTKTLVHQLFLLLPPIYLYEVEDA